MNLQQFRALFHCELCGPIELIDVVQGQRKDKTKVDAAVADAFEWACMRSKAWLEARMRL